jgi:hypothetical protein
MWRLVIYLIFLVIDNLTVQFHAGFDVYMILAHSYMNALHIVCNRDGNDW